jgi:hypothetical protein
VSLFFCELNVRIIRPNVQCSFSQATLRVGEVNCRRKWFSLINADLQPADELSFGYLPRCFTCADRSRCNRAVRDVKLKYGSCRTIKCRRYLTVIAPRKRSEDGIALKCARLTRIAFDVLHLIFKESTLLHKSLLLRMLIASGVTGNKAGTTKTQDLRWARR